MLYLYITLLLVYMFVTSYYISKNLKIHAGEDTLKFPICVEVLSVGLSLIMPLVIVAGLLDYIVLSFKGTQDED